MGGESKFVKYLKVFRIGDMTNEDDIQYMHIVHISLRMFSTQSLKIAVTEHIKKIK